MILLKLLHSGTDSINKINLLLKITKSHKAKKTKNQTEALTAGTVTYKWLQTQIEEPFGNNICYKNCSRSAGSTAKVRTQAKQIAENDMHVRNAYTVEFISLYEKSKTLFFYANLSSFFFFLN